MTEHTETEALADYWRKHIESWRTGGDLQAAYCKAHELIYHRFVYWRRKFEGDWKGLPSPIWYTRPQSPQSRK